MKAQLIGAKLRVQRQIPDENDLLMVVTCGALCHAEGGVSASPYRTITWLIWPRVIRRPASHTFLLSSSSSRDRPCWKFIATLAFLLPISTKTLQNKTKYCDNRPTWSECQSFNSISIDGSPIQSGLLHFCSSNEFNELLIVHWQLK